MSTSEFHLFRRLPTEIRLKIWVLARPPAQLIHAIRTQHIFTESSRGDLCLGRFHLGILSHKAPSILQVCRESRTLLLPTYISGFTSMRTLFPQQYPPRTWRYFTRRNSSVNRHDQLSHMFFPCYHEALVSNKNRSIYWDPENDIIFLHPETWQVGEEPLFKGAVSLWSGQGWTAPVFHGVKKLAMELDYFYEWVLGIMPEDQSFGEATVVYIIMDRKMSEGKEVWKRSLQQFLCWYHRRQLTNPRGFVEERTFDWEVKFVARCDGVLKDEAFEEALSEHDIRSQEEYPPVED